MAYGMWLVVALMSMIVGGCVAGGRLGEDFAPATISPFDPLDLFSASSPFGERSGQVTVAELFPDPKVAALARSLEQNDWDAAAKSLHQGVNINAVGQDNVTLPLWAMYIKNKQAFAWLLRHGADPNSDLGPDRCPLAWAARAKDTDWLRILLAHKANPNLIHIYTAGAHDSMLMSTILYRRLDNLKMLIAAGANVNYQGPIGGIDPGSTAAIDAAQIGWFEGTYVLLEAGADFRPRTSGGFDVAYFIAGRDDGDDLKNPFREKVLQLLRKRGADVDGAMKRASETKAQQRRNFPWMDEGNGRAQ